MSDEIDLDGIERRDRTGDCIDFVLSRLNLCECKTHNGYMKLFEDDEEASAKAELKALVAEVRRLREALIDATQYADARRDSLANEIRGVLHQEAPGIRALGRETGPLRDRVRSAEESEGAEVSALDDSLITLDAAISGVIHLPSLDVDGFKRRTKEARAELSALRERISRMDRLLRDVALSAVTLEDARIDYVEVQIDRQTWVFELAGYRQNVGAT